MLLALSIASLHSCLTQSRKTWQVECPNDMKQQGAAVPSTADSAQSPLLVAVLVAVGENCWD